MAIRPFKVQNRQNAKEIPLNNVYYEFLSFEDICPQWSLALRLGYTNNNNLDIQDAKNCIVGEAHGFRNRGLRCSKCWEYSQSFTFCTYGNKLHKYIITDNPRFEELKFEFVSHFNEKHTPTRYSQPQLFNGLIRGASNILRGLRNLSLRLFLYRGVPRNDNSA